MGLVGKPSTARHQPDNFPNIGEWGVMGLVRGGRASGSGRLIKHTTFPQVLGLVEHTTSKKCKGL
jgi:hypothetical protein